MPRTRSVNCSPTPTSSLAHASNSSSKHDEASSESPVLFSPTFTHSITVNKWPSPPPLPQRSPRIRRRHNLHNYMSLAPTNGSCDVRSSVGAPPPDTPTSDNSGTVQKPVSLTNGEPTASPSGSTHTHTSFHTQDLESPTQKLENHMPNLESLRQTLSALRLKQERVRHHTKFLTLHADQESFPKGFKITLPVQVPDFENFNLQKELFSLQTEIGTKLRDLVLKHYKNLANNIEAKIEATKKNMFHKAEATSLPTNDKQRLKKIIEKK